MPFTPSSATSTPSSFLLDTTTATFAPLIDQVPSPLESPKFSSPLIQPSHPIDTMPSPSADTPVQLTSDVDYIHHLVSRHTPLPSPSSLHLNLPQASSLAARRRTLASAAHAYASNSVMCLPGFLDVPISTSSSSCTSPTAVDCPTIDMLQLDMESDSDMYQEELALSPAYEFNPDVQLISIPDPDLILNLSESLLFGLNGQPKQPAAAFSILQKCTQLYNEEVGARFHALVGFCYEFGIGITQSFINCEPYYLTAGAQGQALAMARLSFLRRYGRPNVRMNRSESEDWQSKVMELTLLPPLACNQPSQHDPNPRMLPDGRTVDPLAWLWWAADMMLDMSSQYALGTCFHDGVGVQRDPVEAVKWYAKSADQGSPRGEGIMGYCYGEGFGIHKDPILALKYYISAATKGETVAMYNVGYCYEEGIGVDRDLKQAFIWYKKAAESGNALAANSLGYFYEEGMGMNSKNVLEAVNWYRISAEQGNPWAEHNLAYMYSTGSGVAKDDVLAFTWYMRAAEQGHAGAQNKLGHCYQNGTGNSRNSELAVYWYRKAADQKYPQACVSLAWCLDNGVGCVRNSSEALVLLDFAISEGYRDHMIADWFISLAQRVAQEKVGQHIRDNLPALCAAPSA